MIVIVGSGLAAYLLAKEFRELNKVAPLRIITQSDGRFYSKPLLSTAFTHQKTADMLTVSSPAEMAEELKAEINTATKVTAINSINKTIDVENEKGESAKIAYDKLILACGSVVLEASIQGEGAPEILSVNDLQDYAVFQNKLLEKPSKKIAIIGAGLVGCEFANDLSNAGYEVDVIALADQPLEKLLPRPLGAALQSSFAEKGVSWHFNTCVEKINKINAGYELELQNGEKLSADLVLSAIGLRANSQLARAAGIATHRGIQVNTYLETNISNIYALGDCAEVNGHLMFYIAPLRKCANALARTLAGERRAVNYPAMSVSIKTPICPTVACPPPEGLLGEWVITGEGKDLRALYYDQQGNLRGFALIGSAVKERAKWTDALPPLF